MGEARRRGTFKERKAAAIKRGAEEEKFIAPLTLSVPRAARQARQLVAFMMAMAIESKKDHR